MVLKTDFLENMKLNCYIYARYVAYTSFCWLYTTADLSFSFT